MDITTTLTRGGTNLLNSLCPERRYLPYWHMVVDADRAAAFEFRPHCDAHNVGRWWNAMLRLSACTGFGIPPEVEAAMLEHTWHLCDNPTGILLQDPDPDQPRTWYIHSYRETMLALGLLVKHRGNARAAAQGCRALAQMREASRDLSCWDLSRCGAMRQPAPLSGGGNDATYTHGRALEGILGFHEATGAPEAMDEAERLAEFHFRHTVQPDGRRAAGCGHHTHSYLNTLRGLIEFARRRQQPERLATLLATYRHAVMPMITRSGFLTHDIADTVVRSGGDIASAGDIAHIALLLWDVFRLPELLDDVERLVRARLVPAQVVVPMPVHSRGEACCRDALLDLPERFIGAIGGSVGHVRGQACVTDFTAAALHSLIAIHERTVDIEDRAVRVNFHFNTSRPGLNVQSRRDGCERVVDIRDATGKPLLVRVPGWTPPDGVRLQVNDRPVAAAIENGFVGLPATREGNRKICLSFRLPEREEREPWREPEATQEHLVFHWRGDEVTRVDPVGPYLDPYPRACRSFRGEF